jgi:uncharacterized RDD family membrane protein YckC
MELTTGRSVNRPTAKESITNFTATGLRAPFALRCGALCIDYILIVAVPVLGLLFDLLVGAAPAKISTSTSWLIAILLGISNIIIFPALSGQTLGMMMCGLRIVRKDGSDPKIGQIILRNTLGYFLTLVTVGLGFLLAAFTPTGRALHDYISGTLVIFGRKRTLK